ISSAPLPFSATFVAGDGPSTQLSYLSSSRVARNPLTEVNMSNINTLNDLRGEVSAIWTSSFFPFFRESHQCQFACALRSLLSPESGCIISGSHVALPNKSVFTEKISDKDVKMFCHHPVSWKEMWVGQLNAQRHW
ncbi:hypothetical protein EV363DRAFT_1161718, partial [Boletus edulis]